MKRGSYPDADDDACKSLTAPPDEMPLDALPMGMPVVQAVCVEAHAQAPAPGAWSSGLCDCMGDCTSLWAVLLCAPVSMGQLWQRTRGTGGSCLLVAGGLWALWLVLYMSKGGMVPSSVYASVEGLRAGLRLAFASGSSLSGPTRWLAAFAVSNAQWLIFCALTMLARQVCARMRP